MKLWTLLEIKTKILQDLDLEVEDFITPDELLSMINAGIDECEAHIHLLKRESEYFLKESVITLVQNQSEYSLPLDIYANKILALTYSKNQDIYPVKRIRSVTRFLDLERIKQEPTTDIYGYMIVNPDPTTGYKIKLYPPAKESGPYLKLWHIRNANRLSLDTDVCDIPEFVYFVIAFAKEKVLFKEGHPNYAEAKADLESQKNLMLETLGEMVIDDDNEMVKDFDHYEEAT